ncbi:hypothetical protein [Actinoplanes xinjiangensis]|uniref:hypothetical protein n=1 Tax=Actinoplanes xinjiangensis TaxID=512350 RepID=UPI0011B85280|nr:hypothetical protein [Actinoplanes xinjiangensis]GIF41975.1 hypothetical protein Axi01nite_62860 [Actinoplanes xinjiangensis]
MEEDHRSAADWVARAFGAFGVLLLAVSSVSVVFWPEPDHFKPATAAVPDLPTRLELQVRSILRGQIDALLSGDEKGWLAPVDTKARSRYRAIYRNLRNLEVSRADYGVEILGRSTERTISARVMLGYCLGTATCPAWANRVDEGAPKLLYELTLAQRDGEYVVTGLADVEDGNHLQPTPWENTELRFVRGSRVIVAGPPGQAKNLKRVLAAAEKAAGITDRFTTAPPVRYRIYLADDRSWKRWYGGQLSTWAVGYHLALNQTGSDIVLKAGHVLDSDRQLALTVQHEMAHAVTMVPSRNRDPNEDLWLIEGIADYIGFFPGKPQNTESRYALRAWFDEHGAITSIVRPQLTEKSDDLAVSTLYATGHYAVGCLVDRYGRARMLDFAKRVLQDGQDLDPAARASFGKPFRTVDKACVSWITQRV